ncbi:MAG: galactokinase, partial [Syntrophothermus sp.]
LLRFTDREELMKNLSELRNECGDRAVLRALHFFGENERAVLEAASLKEGKISEFLELVAESGNSSARWLQNTYSGRSIREQNIPLALEMTEYFMKKRSSKGASRVHGGGFAGTILTFIETGLLKDYISYMNEIFGANSALAVLIRNYGACRVAL